MIHLIRDAMSKGDMRVYFNDDINVFETPGYPAEIVQPALEYLDEVIEGTDYMGLIYSSLQ